ncbi:tRNA (adenine(22)-N(1))-methyltransferase [Aquibacillus saliphilus]|uniref:tRNA (adenine(22)-N(1))-methyltransferase n=1 Tax=Aquibacillus saliphilus TaxID=1909422 RepID=UPI001CEFE1A8|nr:tRNA (adenine(22)-N(1))-methyltransferase TrmK [Aquibacillus saliphilus]
MNKKTLSKRLQQVASFLPEQAVFADIGSDHAYLPCFVCMRDQQAIAIAGEINEGPYQAAKRTVDELNLTDRIEVRKGNGLEVIEQSEVNQVVIAGMGGSLITTILEDGKSKLSEVQRIVVQPNVDAISIRKWFFMNGYRLVNEEIIEEDGHIYEILVADKGSSKKPYTESHIQKEFLFGPYLLEKRSSPFIQRWLSEKEKREKAVKQMKEATVLDEEKILRFESEIKLIEEVLTSG